MVLDEVSTKEASVDIDAERTSSTTSAMRASGSVTSMAGIMLSKAILPVASLMTGS